MRSKQGPTSDGRRALDNQATACMPHLLLA